LVDRIGRRLKLRDLHILWMVAERGSMAKAAHDLSVSQPVVSKAISDLETAVGVRLLDRNRQGVMPTPYGRALLGRSVVAFDELREGVKEIEFLAQPTSGEVRVGALVAMMGGLLPAAIEGVRSRHPLLTVYVKQLITSPDVYEQLRKRTVDFIIGRVLSQTREKDLSIEILFDEPLFIVAGRQSKWASRRKMAIADLLTELWILPEPETEVAAIIAEVFHASGLEVPRAAVICSSIEMYWALLPIGNYLAVLPRSLLHFSIYREMIKAWPVQIPRRLSPVGVVTLKNRTISPAAALFIDHIREITRPLAKPPKPAR
jgi:DNA-binding transcriptional LysR family regulator